MLRTLNSEFDLARLMPCDEELVIAFVPTNRDIYRILQTCHKLKSVYIHPDTFKEMPCVGQTLLYMQKVELVVDDDVPESPSQQGGYAAQNKEEAPTKARPSRLVLVSR
ncbi:MAG TPA: DUF1699 family protein [Methanotrichaceae archaeon]|nr:DUF1699 family protein [Methanotrichaceae archaeon]